MLLDEIKKLLKTVEKYFSKEEELLKNIVLEDTIKMDKGLIKLLMSNEKSKNHFFIEIEGVLIFDKDKFIKFIENKEFLPNSYTTYKNKIGLTDNNGEFIKEKNDVVLSWAYKDCYLEGGQDKEDMKKDEIFYNEILAPDEIDRLLEPKVLTNFKKYDVNGEHKVEDVSMEDNLIIKGNNLLALHSLKEKYAGQIKLIYIDPPYNTGNDSFKYNDRFNHSTWLTFMKNRLEVAKELLKDNGSIFIQIDDNEIGYLTVLMDEIFGRENSAGIAKVKRGSVTGHKAINPGIVNIMEYILIYSKNYNKWKPNKLFKARPRNERYNNYIKNIEKDTSEWVFCSLLDAFSEYRNIPKNRIKKELKNSYEEEIFEFIKKNSNAVIQFAFPDKDKVSVEANNLITVSEKNKGNVYVLKRENDPDMYFINGQRILFYNDRLMNLDGVLTTVEPLSDLWEDILPNNLHKEGGVNLKKGKKSEKILQRIIELGSIKGDLILDFHLGSGTTCAVAHKMGRRYIGIEQMDYIEDISVERLKKVIGNSEKKIDTLFDSEIISNFDDAGISKETNWKGGGSFVYCELMKWNEVFLEKINNAKNTDALIKVYSQIKEKAFLNYKFDIEKFEDKNMKDFKELKLEEQKEIIKKLLDLNSLYVNLSEIEDETYDISDENKNLNKIFYKK